MPRGERGSFAVVAVSKETAERLPAAHSARGSVAPFGAVSPQHGQSRSPCLPGSSPAPPCVGQAYPGGAQNVGSGGLPTPSALNLATFCLLHPCSSGLSSGWGWATSPLPMPRRPEPTHLLLASASRSSSGGSGGAFGSSCIFKQRPEIAGAGILQPNPHTVCNRAALRGRRCQRDPRPCGTPLPALCPRTSPSCAGGFRACPRGG